MLGQPGTYDQVAYRGDDIQSLIRSARKVDLSRLTDPDIPVSDV